MNNKEFTEKVAECLQNDARFFNFHIKISDDETGIIITDKEDESISMMFYVSDPVVLSKPAAEAAESLYQAFYERYRQTKNLIKSGFVVPLFSLAVEVVNYEANKEFLNNVPHVRKLDLALYVSCMFSYTNNMRTPIDYQLLDKLGLSFEKALEIGFENIRNNAVAVIVDKTGQNHSIPFSLLLDGSFDFTQCNHIMITTTSAEFGTSLLLDDLFFKIFSEKISKKFCVIPASKHEMLICSDAYPDYALKNVLDEINKKMKKTRPDIFVSDHVYVCENGVVNILI